jgi:predicted enzyme related to lactoylglutathione lyase
MTNIHGDFIWYELMTTDADAAQDFYGGLVGWSFKDGGQSDMDYRLFSADGPQVGGVMPLSQEMQDGGARPMWAGYIGVDDVDATAQKIRSSGGTIMMEPQDIPDVGRFAFVRDPQGVPFYIMRGLSDEPSESFAHDAPREGHCAWNELLTSDLDAADAFYGDCFGWVAADSMDMGEAGPYRIYRNGEHRASMFGAMMKRPESGPPPIWLYYFRVPDIDEAATFIGAHGGAVVIGPQEIPGGEYVLNGTDPQGAIFALIGKWKGA